MDSFVPTLQTCEHTRVLYMYGILSILIWTCVVGDEALVTSWDHLTDRLHDWIEKDEDIDLMFRIERTEQSVQLPLLDRDVEALASGT